MFNGRPVENGVYVWVASVIFIDDFVDDYSGDITVLR